MSKTKDRVVLRESTSADAPAISTLVGQLGYPATPAELIDRMDALRRSPAATLLVADLNGTVVGLVSGHVIRSIHSTPPVAWLTTLVVDEAHHGLGIGRQLASAIEEWARRQGVARIAVTSGLQRSGAHSFYERIGYERSGVRLTKIFGPR